MKPSYLVFLFFISSSCLFGQMDSIYFDGMYRTYNLHLPTDYLEGENVPMLIAMHGGFGSGEQLENQSQLSTKADDENFIVVYPDGVKSPINIRTWNAGNCCGYASNTNVDDVGFISALMDSLMVSYSIDSLRVYATGMSNGAFMSYRLACELSDRIAAIAPVAGTMVANECLTENSVPIIHFHSYLDSNVPYLGGIGDGVSSHHNPPLDSVLTVWSGIDGCTSNADTLVDNFDFTHVVWEDCECNYSIEYYITQDGGHSWPGGVESALGDPVSQVINANDLMWSFFENYSLECGSPLELVETPIEKQQIKIYPNPTTGSLILVGKKIQHIIVYNIGGQAIINLEISPSDMLNIDLSNETRGNYYAQVELEGGYTEILKIVLQ